MLLSTHERLTGKASRDLLSQAKFGWQTIELSWPEAFEWITVGGYATSSALNSDYRNSSQFKSRRLFMVDIDSGMTIPELFEDSFYNEFGAGFYVTPSHRDDSPRFRIMFRTELPIESHDECCHLISSLLSVYDHADTSCKDASRLYFGTVDCQVKEIRENIIPADMVQLLVDAGLEREAQKQVSNSHVERTPPTDTQKGDIVRKLCGISVIPYEDWMHIAWGLKSGGFTLSDFQLITASTTGKTGGRTAREAERMWNSPNRGQITMGSVIHFIKQNYKEQRDITIREIFRRRRYDIY